MRKRKEGDDVAGSWSGTWGVWDPCLRAEGEGTGLVGLRSSHGGEFIEERNSFYGEELILNFWEVIISKLIN